MIKHFFIATFVLLMLVTAVMAQTADTQSWNRYTIGDREFSVNLPVTPVLITSKTIVEGRELSEQKLKATDTPAVYTVDVYENAKQQSLDDFIGKHSLRKGWDPSSEKGITVNGVAGKEFVFQNKQVVVQFFATKERLYRFTTAGTPTNDSRVKQFFSSIVIGEKVAGVKVDPEPSILYFREESLEPYKGKDVDQKVRLITKPPPSLPAGAEGRGGRVILITVFSAAGQVVNIRVVHSADEDLKRAAIEAARQIEFTPALKDGKPVSMWMQLEYNFNM